MVPVGDPVPAVPALWSVPVVEVPEGAAGVGEVAELVWLLEVVGLEGSPDAVAVVLAEVGAPAFGVCELAGVLLTGAAALP